MVAMTVLPEEMPRETLDSVLRRIGDRPFTVEDLAELPDDGLRYEIDEGVLIVNAAPSDFWIVGPDPDKPSITAFALDGKRYRQAGFTAGGETFTAARPFPVSFTPLDLVDTGA